MNNRIKTIVEVFESRIDADIAFIKKSILDSCNGQESGDYICNNQKIITCLEKVSINILCLKTLDRILYDIES